MMTIAVIVWWHTLVASLVVGLAAACGGYLLLHVLEVLYEIRREIWQIQIMLDPGPGDDKEQESSEVDVTP